MHGRSKASAGPADLEQLVVRHDAALRRFLRKLVRCEESAADAAQDAYLRMLRFAPAVADPRAYLFSVAANAAHDRIAREARHRAAPADLAETAAAPEPGAETQCLHRQRLARLARAVDALPPRCRQVFLMSRCDGLSNAEIAQRLAISRNMVEKHIIRALLHCRQADRAGD